MQSTPRRFNLASIARRHRLAVLGLTVLGCFSVGAVAVATAENSARYPYDPACAWGRLSDGHGMLLRCLEPSEASALLEQDVAVHSAPASQPKSASSKGAPRSTSIATDSGRSDTRSVSMEPMPTPGPAGATPAGSGAAGTSPAGSSAASGAVVPPSSQKLAVTTIGPAQPDEGELPLADKKLSAPKDRYIECVAKNGGLSAERGRVVLRFLVRERGRAEGIEVKSVVGMSRAAADCIADVVDRRYVGYPAVPIVGATFPIELSVVR